MTHVESLSGRYRERFCKPYLKDGLLLYSTRKGLPKGIERYAKS